MATPGSVRTDSALSLAGRRARASKPFVLHGSTPPALTSSGGSAPSCRCSCGWTCPTSRWASIGNPPPIARICSTCCPAASLSFGAFAERKAALTSVQKKEVLMRRRDLLTAAGASVAVLAAPRIGRAERPNKLVFVPTEDLSVLDPHFAGPRSRRTHAYLVFDTLYGLDTNWMAQPQMVEGHQVDEDGLTWSLTLRDGLRFHDKEPVLARDVVASIRRFAARISFAYALMAATEELSAPDDRTVRFRLKRPFPHLPDALVGPGGIVPVPYSDIDHYQRGGQVPSRTTSPWGGGRPAS